MFNVFGECEGNGWDVVKVVLIGVSYFKVEVIYDIEVVESGFYSCIGSIMIVI